MYELKEMNGKRAIKILENVLKNLFDIEPEDLTTFERNLLYSIAENPPKHTGDGAEKYILNHK